MRDLSKALFKLLIALLITLPLFPQFPQLIIQRFLQREKIPIPAGGIQQGVRFLVQPFLQALPDFTQAFFHQKQLDRQSDCNPSQGRGQTAKPLLHSFRSFLVNWKTRTACNSYPESF